jgi:hypothetical protein
MVARAPPPAGVVEGLGEEVHAEKTKTAADGAMSSLEKRFMNSIERLPERAGFVELDFGSCLN